MTTPVCDHGCLARKCPLCEAAALIVELQEKLNAEVNDHFDTQVREQKLIEERDALRADRDELLTRIDDAAAGGMPV